jgi:hypothetical protein
MQAHAIAERWITAFGEVAPLGHLCRVALAHRWLRVHSLPGSKRYADTPSECAAILSRWATVANAALGANCDCHLFFTAFPDTPARTVLDLLPHGSPEPIWIDALAAYAEDYDAIKIAALPLVWRPGDFDRILTACADDRTGPLLFVNLERGTAFAPYDGGADVFFDSPASVAAHRQTWSAWLSPRPDGL